MNYSLSVVVVFAIFRFFGKVFILALYYFPRKPFGTVTFFGWTIEIAVIPVLDAVYMFARTAPDECKVFEVRDLLYYQRFYHRSGALVIHDFHLLSFLYLLRLFYLFLSFVKGYVESEIYFTFPFGKFHFFDIFFSSVSCIANESNDFIYIPTCESNTSFVCQSEDISNEFLLNEWWKTKKLFNFKIWIFSYFALDFIIKMFS